MTVQRKGVPLKELKQVKDSSAKSMAGREGTAPTKNVPNTPCPPPAEHRKTPQLLSKQNVLGPPLLQFFAVFQVPLC